MNTKHLFTFAAAAILTTSTAFAQGFGHGGPGGDFRHGGGMGSSFRIAPPGMWWKNTDLATKLAITADQQKRMDDIVQQSRIELVHLRANLEEQQILLEPMLNANPPDSSKVLAQIGKIADLRANLEKANAKMLLGIRGVLTADQWTKLQAERHARHEMPGRDGHAGPGGSDRRGGGPGGRGRGPGGPGGPGRGPVPSGGSTPSTPPPAAE